EVVEGGGHDLALLPAVAGRNRGRPGRLLRDVLGRHALTGRASSPTLPSSPSCPNSDRCDRERRDGLPELSGAAEHPPRHAARAGVPALPEPAPRGDPVRPLRPGRGERTAEAEAPLVARLRAGLPPRLGGDRLGPGGLPHLLTSRPTLDDRGAS